MGEDALNPQGGLGNRSYCHFQIQSYTCRRFIHGFRIEKRGVVTGRVGHGPVHRALAFLRSIFPPKIRGNFRGSSMASKAVLITGAGGEIGHGLIDFLAKENQFKIIALDLKEISAPKEKCDFVSVTGDILNRELLAGLFEKYDIAQIFHLAAILSSGGERNPERTHQVNVEGSLNLFSLAKTASQAQGKPVTFLFPSTIAVYGLPGVSEKNKAGKVREDQYLAPITMYGANKLYVENLGRYYSDFYKLLDDNKDDIKVDFRAVRFPGLMSADTLPTGGTSDYGSEMIHAAAQGRAYECFVSPTSKLPFMAMPDAIRCLIELSRAPADRLTRRSYNVGAFAVSAEEICAKLLESFPNAEIGYHPNLKRQGIVETWPADVDDSKARADWGWAPSYGFHAAFTEYLIPGISAKYR